MSKWTDRSRSDGSPLAVAVMFIGNGLVMGSSLSRMPEIRDQVGATPPPGICARLRGNRIDRFHAVYRFARGPLLLDGGQSGGHRDLSCGLGARAISDFGASLAVIMLAAGLGTGVGDVAMNIQGNVVEQRRNKVLMPFWHGLFSVGEVAGAMAGALAASLCPSHNGFRQYRFSCWWRCGWRQRSTCRTQNRIRRQPRLNRKSPSLTSRSSWRASAHADRWQSSITRVEILLGIIVFGTAVGEGAANDWLALVLVDNRGAPAASVP